jgi:hypothetical protein
MLSSKIRTILITGIAAASFGGAAIVPGAALASKTQKELKDSGYTCEHTATDFTVCTDSNGHEWYCEESTDKCEQIKLEGHKPRITELVAPAGMLKAPEAGSPPPTRVLPPRLASARV